MDEPRCEQRGPGRPDGRAGDDERRRRSRAAHGRAASSGRPWGPPGPRGRATPPDSAPAPRCIRTRAVKSYSPTAPLADRGFSPRHMALTAAGCNVIGLRSVLGREGQGVQGGFT